MTPTYMSGDEYKRAVEAVGLSVRSARLFFAINISTSKRWRAGTSPVPKAVAMLLRTMIKHKLQASEVDIHIARPRIDERRPSRAL